MQKNPTTKSMFESRTWYTAADFYNALIARYHLQEDSFKAAAFTDLFNFDPANDTLHDLLDRFDVKILTLKNVGEIVSDAMKVTLLKRCLASSKNALHVRVSDALELFVNVLDYARLCEIIHDFDQNAPRSGTSAVTTTQLHAVLHKHTVNYAGVTHKSQGRGPPRRSSRPDRRSSVAKARISCDLCESDANRTWRCEHLALAIAAVRRQTTRGSRNLQSSKYAPRGGLAVALGRDVAPRAPPQRLRWSTHRDRPNNFVS